jgi:predicted GTPase
MRAQTLAAVTGADAALFLIDARAGVTPLDEEIARWLREQDTPVILAANKAEGRAGEKRHPGSLFAGLGEPIAISAEHGEGVVDLFEQLLPHMEREKPRRALRTKARRGRSSSPSSDAQCRQVDPDQPHPGTGAADHRPRGGDYARFDRDRLDLDRAGRD